MSAHRAAGPSATLCPLRTGHSVSRRASLTWLPHTHSLPSPSRSSSRPLETSHSRRLSPGDPAVPRATQSPCHPTGHSFRCRRFTGPTDCLCPAAPVQCVQLEQQSNPPRSPTYAPLCHTSVTRAACRCQRPIYLGFQGFGGHVCPPTHPKAQSRRPPS